MSSDSDSLHPLVNQNLVDTKKFFCPFLERGNCRETSRCNFSHNSCESIKIPSDYCRFYLANHCLYGQDCKFRHDEPLPVLERCPYVASISDLESFDTAASSSSEANQYEFCDLCGRPCLNPYNIEQQRQHREECLREHEREMELSFAVQRSKDKVCGICMDTVVEKKPVTSSRFGILEKCNHIFCLDCIRKWRGTKQFETRTIRACPECRISSDFVVPSKYWIEDQEDKDKLIQHYKAALKAKPCKYFNEGKGECPFAGSCFYKHAYPDGRIAKLDSPKPRRRLHGTRSQTSTVANYILWNLLTSTDDDDWLNDEAEFFYFDPDYVTTDDDDDIVYQM